MNRLVILESPYAGEVEENVAYARACLRDSLLRGETPIASHLLYTQPGVLRDEVPAERQHGIDAGLAWGSVAEATVVYTDRGVSRGMKYGIEAAERAGRPVEYRTLPSLHEGEARTSPSVNAPLRLSDGPLPETLCPLCLTEPLDSRCKAYWTCRAYAEACGAGPVAAESAA